MGQRGSGAHSHLPTRGIVPIMSIYPDLYPRQPLGYWASHKSQSFGCLFVLIGEESRVGLLSGHMFGLKLPDFLSWSKQACMK